MRLGDLADGKPLENGKIYHCQYQRLVLFLVDFYDKLIQYKLPDYILDKIPRVTVWNINY